MLKSTSIPKEADVVVVGGGTAGVLVASRLAKADQKLSIVVLEHGINTRDNPTIVNPGYYFSHLAPSSNTATFYTSKPSDELGGRESIVPTGGCLGGGSSINFMVYLRPQSIDFDDWETEGWSGKDMLPFLKERIELMERSLKTFKI
ncbi:glucose-methanol-choline oxidoreductase [Xylogone sp. PMI_703]|nr:glucose-methanol-choline oxidoreductase [Xylogone sp. PMI_703]